MESFTGKSLFCIQKHFSLAFPLMTLCPNVAMREVEFPRFPSPGHPLPARCWYSPAISLFFQVFHPHLSSLCSPDLFVSSPDLFYFTSFPWISADFVFSLCREVCQAYSRWVSLMLSSEVCDALLARPPDHYTFQPASALGTTDKYQVDFSILSLCSLCWFFQLHK